MSWVLCQGQNQAGSREKRFCVCVYVCVSMFSVSGGGEKEAAECWATPMSPSLCLTQSQWPSALSSRLSESRRYPWEPVWRLPGGLWGHQPEGRVEMKWNQKWQTHVCSVEWEAIRCESKVEAWAQAAQRQAPAGKAPDSSVTHTAAPRRISWGCLNVSISLPLSSSLPLSCSLSFLTFIAFF